MKPITYGAVEERYTLGDECRTSYGIVAYADVASDGTAIVVASEHDISEDRDSVEELARLCNELSLSPLQLHDVVEDFLTA